MLALTRRKGESLVLNNNIEVTILEIRGDQIKIGITAPKEVPIYRKEVYLQIEDENKAAFDSLYAHKSEIEAVLGTALHWNRGDDIKSSKIYIQLNNVSIENETDWLQMANFHADCTKKFYDVIVPYIAKQN